VHAVDSVLNLEPIGLVLVVIRTSVVYAALLVALRMAGKRELGQMTTFDLVVLLLLSNAVQNAMLGPDTSLTGGIVAALTLLALNRAVDRLSLASSRVRGQLVGIPTVLLDNGALVSANLRREGISGEDVMQALREHGIADMGKVQMAVLEVDGTISVVPAEAPVIRTQHRVRGRKPR
jgi:uncharacterized membrane protein YcaP (DUF421 family)